MSRKLRHLALALPLTCLALASAEAVGPAPLGTCRMTCVGSGTFTPLIYSATQNECCSVNPNHCPPGTSPRGVSWNYNRC